MSSPGEIVARGWQLVGSWHGRETPGQFWPYAAMVFVGFVIVGNGVAVVTFLATFRASPDTRTVALTTTFGVVTLGTVALLAAAVTRRLHDRGLSGAWALIPLVLLIVTFFVQAAVMLTVDEDSGPGLFLVAFGLAVLYFVAIIALIVQLALPSRSAHGQKA